MENLSDLLGKYDEEGQFEGYEGGKGDVQETSLRLAHIHLMMMAMQI